MIDTRLLHPCFYSFKELELMTIKVKEKLKNDGFYPCHINLCQNRFDIRLGWHQDREQESIEINQDLD